MSAVNSCEICRKLVGINGTVGHERLNNHRGSGGKPCSGSGLLVPPSVIPRSSDYDYYHTLSVNHEMASNRSVCGGHKSVVDLDMIEKRLPRRERDILWDWEMKYWRGSKVKHK